MASEKVMDAKKQIVSEIENKLKDSASAIFFDYRGLTAAETVELRSKLKASNTEVKIYKNTLTKRALDNLELNLDDILVGPNAMTLSENVIEPIKVLTDYAKNHKALEIKGGIIDGKISTIEEIAKLATIPSREGLLTMLAGGLIGVARDLSICLHLYSEQKSE
ncbi:MAG TPA: 50S ribosomal protein L10 [Mollicutes bacterium]|nr:50S ribosomal protein L10 [Mollicutes bacterium]